MRMRLETAVIVCVALGGLGACTKDDATPAPKSGAEEVLTIDPTEATLIAEEAYVYAYPMMESYRTMYVQAIDRTAPGYLGPFNALSHQTTLLGPEFEDIVRPNNDTMYSMAWLDLRAQPMVLSVPEVTHRYYSVQLIDAFTHNFAYVGTRTTGTKPGTYLIAGPRWDGVLPDDVDEAFQSQTDFAYCIIRIEARGPEDVDAVSALQQKYRLTPWNVFAGHPRAPAASGVTFPLPQPNKMRSSGFIDLFNFLLEHVMVTPGERALMERFARIGVRPGALSASLGLTAEMREAIDAGVGQGIVAIARGARDPGSLEGVRARAAGGWVGLDGLFGDGESMRGRYLTRAVAAMVGLFGNDFEEAYYPMANEDASGNPLDGSKHDYVVRFGPDELPPVDAFWSITMYSLPEQLMVANPIGRYSIGDRSQLRHGPDGSLTIAIQHDSPGARAESNWLPAPEGPFSLQLRMYVPKPEAAEPLYLPPPIQTAR